VVLRTVIERLKRPRPLIAMSLFPFSGAYILAHPYLLGTAGSANFFTTYANPGHILADLAAIAFFASAVLGSPLLSGALALGPLGFLGRISYSMFLLHQTIIVTIGFPLLASFAQSFAAGPEGAWAAWGAWGAFSVYALIVLVLSTIVGYLSYRYVESPFLRRKPG
jgi:peptidoglycan/LPS O-acetylase OafA/YrhL